MAAIFPRPDKFSPLTEIDGKTAAQSWFDFWGYLESQIKSFASSIAGYESAWTTWVPTVTAGTGTFTALGTVVARYKQIGKTVFFYITIPITTNGTAATFIQTTLPATAANTANQTACGQDSALTGKMLSGRVVVGQARLLITLYDATYPGANGAVINVSGSYETT